jgi:adenylate kinase
LTPDDISIIEESLETGVLLEDHQFHIAEKLLRAFIGARAVSETEWLIMNGLPRHVGQAGRLEALVIVDLVVYLACADETVYRRILENSGGDRTGRRDDTQDAVARKLAIFGERTRPLLAYYESRRVPITTVGISRPTSPAEVVEKLVKGELTP